jgi:homoserine kinase
LTSVEVIVPASATNLGPGFDALGVALRLHNRISLHLRPGPVSVDVSGEGADSLSRGADNLVYRAVSRLYEEVGQASPELAISLHNAVPVARGLGSSSTAIVGGLVGANTLLGDPLDRSALLRLAVEMEGHPDNVTPALLGGLQVTAQGPEGLAHLRLPTPEGLSVVVCVPQWTISTEQARRALPDHYNRDDAVFNIGRTALLVGALVTGSTGLLKQAMQDRIHQPYRASLLPGFEAAVRAALDAGAAGACLSGSGSTILALATGGVEAIGAAMVAAMGQAGIEARWLHLEVDEEGAVAAAIPAPAAAPQLAAEAHETRVEVITAEERTPREAQPITAASAGGNLEELRARIQELISPCAGRVEYGNLRSRISDWDNPDGSKITNLALVYETPGGSTDQINVSYHHQTGQFAVIDQEGEKTTSSLEVVLAAVRPRVSGIPARRQEALRDEIRRQIDGGSNTAGLFGHLNRMLQSEFKGGTLTHLELRDAMTFAVQYMKGKK